jgi:hemerythrin-like metal-binding protein
MSLLAWNDMFSVGVLEIDNQHKKLIEITNRLNAAMTADLGHQALSGILGDLLTYTQTHFAYEERLMDRHRYLDREQHLLEHRKLVQIVVDFQNKFAQGEVDLTSDLMVLLRDWLSRHIMNSDRTLGKALNLRGVH